MGTATPTLTGLSNQTKTVGDAAYTLAPTSASDGTITYSSSNTSVATVNSTTGAVTIVSAGSATISAAQAASGNYGTASANYTLSVSAAVVTASPVVVPPPPPPPPPALPPVTNAPPPLTLQPAGSNATSSGGSTFSGDAGATGRGGVAVSLVRQPSVVDSGLISVSVPKDTATQGEGFSFPLPSQVAEAASGSGANVVITTLAGTPLPSWLRYVPENKTFVASAVPDGALPIQVQIVYGNQRVIVVVSEHAER